MPPIGFNTPEGPRTVVEPGVKAITDNWLLQHVAEIHSRANDPLEESHVIADFEAMEGVPIRVGAIQLASLATMIEQLVLCSRIFVMHGWTNAWDGDSTLELFRSAEWVTEFGPSDDVVNEQHDKFNAQFLAFPGIAKYPGCATRHWRPEDDPFFGQLVNGTSAYLARAEMKGFPYWPHPARGLLLQQTVMGWKRPSPIFDRFEEIVSQARVRYARCVGADTVLGTLRVNLPSLAVACIADSGPQGSALMVAAQHRTDKNFERIRLLLQEASDTSPTETKRIVALARELEASAEEAERRLKIGNPKRSAIELELSLFGLKAKVPVPVPEVLHRSLGRKHVAVMTRLIEGGRMRTEELIKKVFGMADRRLVQDVIRLDRIRRAAREI